MEWSSEHLKKLPKGARVKYTGPVIERKIVPGTTSVVLKTGTYCYKIRNGKGQYSSKMHVYAVGDNQWAIDLHYLTNDTIEVAKKLTA